MVARTFKNRLFDRDTLLIAHYDVNFLFILSLYAQNNAIRKAGWKRIVRDKFRTQIRKLLEDNFDFYAMTPKEDGKEEGFLRQDFQKTLGKVYKPFAKVNGRSYYALALDSQDSLHENKEVKAWLEKGFLLTDPKTYKLGDDPVAALASKVAAFDASGGKMPVFGVEAAFLILSSSDEGRTWKWNKTIGEFHVLRSAIPAANPMDVKYVKITKPMEQTKLLEIECRNPGGAWAWYQVI